MHRVHGLCLHRRIGKQTGRAAERAGEWGAPKILQLINYLWWVHVYMHVEVFFCILY